MMIADNEGEYSADPQPSEGCVNYDDPTEEQMEHHSNPNWEVDEHQRRIAQERQKAFAEGRTFGIRDYYDPRFDGPW
jgi:hypothetical protein